MSLAPKGNLLRAIGHDGPDWSPNDLGGCGTAGFHNVAYDRPKEVPGVDDPPTRVCTCMNNAVFEASLWLVVFIYKLEQSLPPCC